MKQVVIENPVLNSPFKEPTRHFRFSDEGITDEVVDRRRVSAYFIPIAQPRKKSKQLGFETEWTKDRIKENDEINRIRSRVALWRDRGYPHITKTTRRLLDYWTNPDRDKKLFFCQVEAVETAIYLAEAAEKSGDGWIANMLREASDEANPGLFRIAFKMATGAGKTVVMGMLIAWQALNKLANPQSPLFSDAFLIVTPGITIRDRLRVLLPNDPQNYYRERDILPADLLDELGKAKLLITNFHAFLFREKGNIPTLNKRILLRRGRPSPFTEAPDEMVRRVCRELGAKKSIVVLNDEAHHCYRRKVEAEDEKLTGDDRREAQKRDEEARVWVTGLQAVQAKLGIKAVYDLSATPFFLRGSGYPEGTLFPWVVSDFSLIDAIESGIVKVPRVPVADDSMTGELPTYRNIWDRIRDHLPKKGRKTEDASGGEPNLPAELQGALHSLYSNYEKYYRKWEQNAEARAKGQTPPVFIVVCNNTNVSNLVYRWISGWEKPLPSPPGPLPTSGEGGGGGGARTPRPLPLPPSPLAERGPGGEVPTVVVPGELAIFSNEENGGWRGRPNTVLIDSEQLESGEAMSADFKKIAAHEIDRFKAEYRIRFPGRDTEKLTDEDLLREVMNTVGKPGLLGEHVKCVVSVSMLTEGWDANTVTHILGVRAFGTQLLCEQVVGRGLRRTNYVPEADGMLSPQYAEVYGVPFSFIPCSGTTASPKPGPMPTRVRALEGRIACEITFPRVAGYRWELPEERLTARFTTDSHLALTTRDVPTRTEIEPIVGEPEVHTLDGLRRLRPQAVAFRIAKLTLETYFRDDDGNAKHWLFPQLLRIATEWMDTCVYCKDNAFKQMLWLAELRQDAADRIYRAIVASEEGEKALKPLLQPYNTLGSTRYVDFDTTRPVYATDARFCHISHVVADTASWEQKMAQAIEELAQEGLVLSYVKNQGLGFAIPYTLSGEEHNYLPDFIVRLEDGQGTDDPLNLILEVTGERDKDKQAKADTARTLWVPAVNNHGGFGRWAFIEISDPWDAKNCIRSSLRPRS